MKTFFKNYGFILVFVLKIPLHHRKFIKISKQGQAVSVHIISTLLSSVGLIRYVSEKVTVQHSYRYINYILI